MKFASLSLPLAALLNTPWSPVAVVQAEKMALTGTNIGGWMVLEPWITPSLFYRYLGLNNTESQVGMDSYTFCESLGPEKGNEVMRAHWDSWYTEDHIKELADRKVEMVRLPIGDWTLEPYGPYVGCMDGAEDKIQWMFDTCARHNITVLLDVHTMKNSQNGFDNSGQARDVEWTDGEHFKHWSLRNAEWMGVYDKTEKTYELDFENLKRSLSVSEGLLQRWG
mmetsp:Transcript_17923/g.30486  ORF Transcript_17923/g.30486 Transcript_17923/m.30486 type:complete len:223 (+) Transcript_17923:2-670(+)